MLLLFDIDGTLLLKASDAHARSLRVALHEVYGVGTPDGEPERQRRTDLAGRTDIEIARELALAHGRSAEAFDAGRERLAETCVREYARRAPADLSAHLAPGVVALLRELAATDAVRLALVTGNLEGVARTKLARAGIGSYFAAGQGAFGSDSEDRTDLPPLARARAGAHELPYPRERTVVIGDTPRDIACARSDGLRCIAVTTGAYTADELRGADAVAESAGELRELVRAELRRSARRERLSF